MSKDNGFTGISKNEVLRQQALSEAINVCRNMGGYSDKEIIKMAKAFYSFLKSGGTK